MSESTKEPTEIILTEDQVAEVIEIQERFNEVVKKYNLPAVFVALAPTSEGVSCAVVTHFDMAEHIDTLLKARGMGIALHRCVKIVAEMAATKGSP